MKVVLLITLIFTLALVRGWNPQPCMPSWNNNAYDNFLHRHILHKDFNRSSREDWRRYLQQNNLCYRPRQTFMEKSDQRRVEQICQAFGFRYKPLGNFCISDSPIRVYDLTVDNNCQIQTLVPATKYVVVACDVIDNVCRPVHFERSVDSSPIALCECGMKLCGGNTLENIITAVLREEL